MDTPDPQPPPTAPSLVRVVAGIAIVFIVVAVIAGLVARQGRAREADRIEALQQELRALRNQMDALAADSERTAVLSFTEGGYFPLRTNAGTLLVAVANVEPVEKGLRVDLRLGNPQSMTYLGYTLAFSWNGGKGQQAFREPLEPGTWTAVPLMLSPADPKTTRSLTITSAWIDEIPAR